MRFACMPHASATDLTRSIKSPSGVDMTRLNISFEGKDLSGFNFSNADLERINLKNAIFEDAIINDTRFYGSSIEQEITLAQIMQTKSYKDKDLSGASFQRTVFENADFSGFNMQRTMFGSSASNLFTNVNFTNADLRGAGYTAGRNGWDFSGQNLRSARFFRAVITAETNFTGANLMNVSFYDANLIDAVFIRADLRGANITASHIGFATMKNTIGNDGEIIGFSMTSAADSFSIRKHVPSTSNGDNIVARLEFHGGNYNISGGAVLTLERGAQLECSSDTGRLLTFDIDSMLMINTDMDSSTRFSVRSLANDSGLEFKSGAKLAVNIELDEDEIFNASDYASIIVMDWTDETKVVGLSEFVKDETLFLSLNGEKFSGEWDYAIDNNKFIINISQVPEPAAYAITFGILAFVLAARRRRK